MNKYSILIPIHNEIEIIPTLLQSLEPYVVKGHEIIIIDDGSNDGSSELLKADNKFNLISIAKNKGKGFAIRKGLEEAANNKIIIFDGDMELHTSDIAKLMFLDEENGIRAIMGYRYRSLNPFKSNFEWGNFMFTSFFNILFQTNHKDILCCAKAFYIDHIKIQDIKSRGFDIDVELSSVLTIVNKKSIIPQVLMKYNRRDVTQGKKLKVSDGWIILERVLMMIKYF